MSKLTAAAEGQECTINLYPYCNGDVATTVFAHAPSEDKGMGIKSPDWWGADSCSICHDIVDGRRSIPGLYASEIFECFMHGVFKTFKRRIAQGLIKV